MAVFQALQSPIETQIPEPFPSVSPAPPADLQRLRTQLAHHPLTRHIQSARELIRSRESDEGTLLPTAVPELDRLLAGGLGRGELVEIVGRPTSGRFSLVLAVLAAATGAGEAAALVDLGDHLDPQAAAQTGVDLERLLWLRPRHLREVLAGAEMLVTGGFPLVLLDLGSPPVRGGRRVEACWLRLTRVARRHRTALLVSTPYRMSGTAAAAVVQLHPIRPSWQGGNRSPYLLERLLCRLVLEKCRGRRAGSEEMLALQAPEATSLLPSAAVGASQTGEGSESKAADMPVVPDIAPTLSRLAVGR